MKKIIIVIALIVSIIPVYVLANDSCVSETDVKLTSDKVSIDNEVEFYRELYEKALNEKDQIANTIYWAIGAIFTLSLFIIGGNLYLNLKVYKSDYEKLQSEYLRNLKGLEQTINQGITTQYKKSKNELNNKIESKIKASLANLRAKNNEQEIRLLLLEAEKNKDVPSNYADSLLDAIELAYKSGNTFLVDWDAMPKLNEVLKTIKKEDTYTLNKYNAFVTFMGSKNPSFAE